MSWRLDVRRSALAALLRFPDMKESCGLSAEDFIEPAPRNQNAWMGQVFRVIDDDRVELIEDVGANQYDVASLAMVDETLVEALPGRPATRAAADAAVDRLRQLLWHARLDAGVRDILQRISKEPDIDRPGSQLWRELSTFLEEHGDPDDAADAKLSGELVEKYRSAVETDKTVEQGFPLPLKKTNETIRGLRPGQVTVVAARPGVGKTTLAVQIAESLAASAIRTSYFSGEMSEEDIGERLGRAIVGRPLNEALTLPDKEKLAGWEAPDRERQWRFYDSLGSIPIDMLKRQCAIDAVQHGIAVFVIDNLMHVDYGQSRAPEWERVSRSIMEIRRIARRYSLHGIVLHHLGRQADYVADDEMPLMSMLRGSGDVENQSDTILFMMRDSHEASAPGGFGDTGRLIVGKSRMGARVGTEIRVQLDLASQAYVELLGPSDFAKPADDLIDEEPYGGSEHGWFGDD